MNRLYPLSRTAPECCLRCMRLCLKSVGKGSTGFEPSAVRATALSASSDQDWTNWFGTDSSGPHPYQTNTVLVRVHCCSAEVHRALKHYETEVERFLVRLNKRIRPRFLFSGDHFQTPARPGEFGMDSAVTL
ncbi:MAG: hypothetical protein K9K64_07660 [Desulfohalobiaceae bacterium]|nr:hypothetical protein [Desulfohalobiaceae bacterium]